MIEARTGCGARVLRLLVLLPLLGPLVHGCVREDAAMPKAPTPDADAPPALLRVPACAPARPILLDGTGRDNVWARAAEWPSPRLAPPYACEPTMPSRAAVVRAGRWLLFGVDAHEADGIVARQVAHGVDLWHEDAFVVTLGGSASLEVVANPLGAVCCYRGGKRTMEPIADRAVRAAARVRRDAWRVELAVDLRQVPVADAGTLRCRLSRQRQARGLTPFEETAAPPVALSLGPGEDGPAEVRLDVPAPQRFAGRAALETALANEPPTSAEDWARMPACLLRHESGRGALPADFQPTEVRACAAAGALLLHIRCLERRPATIADAGEALWAEDSVEVFLGPEGFNYLQVAANPNGVLKAATGKTGGRRIRPAEPPKGVTVRAERTTRAWTLRLAIPLPAVAKLVGAPADCLPPAWPWRVQIVRNRPARDALGQGAQCSVLNVTHSGNAHCPARFGALRLVRPTGRRIAAPRPREVELPPPVLDAAARKRRRPHTLVRRWLDARSRKLHAASEEAFAKIHDADGWRAYAGPLRDRLWKSMFPSAAGHLAQARGELNARIVYDLPGEGYRCRGLIFESRGGLPVPATLYVPAGASRRPREKRPALIMIPAHHTGRNSRDLAILGANFARAGGVAVAMESIGSGERGIGAPWAHKNHQRCVAGVQAHLAGDNLAGWTAFDISRAVDYLLLERDDVAASPRRIALVGGVAGGGDVSAVAAALDDRIAVSIPFNFSATGPMDAWYDPLRSTYGAHAGGLSAWNVAALAAPRCLAQAQEFAWTPAEQSRHERFERLYGWLGAPGNLAKLHGGPNTHATHFNWMHRIPMYRLLNRWLGMKLPTRREDELTDMVPPGRLDCFDKPLGRKHLRELRRARRLIQPHELAAKTAGQRLAYARRDCRLEARRRGAAPAQVLADRLTRLLGDTTPAPAAPARTHDLGTWHGAEVRGLWLPTEGDAEGPGAAAWLLLPKAKAARPAVIGVCQSGKRRFLARRARDVQRLLEAGVAVCLVDVRGCGETSPGSSRLPDGPSADVAFRHWMLRDALPLRQLKDLRTALAWLARREGIDARRLAVWGEGLSTPNGRESEAILFDEVPFRQASPMPKEPAEPLGGLLAMLAALWPIQADGGVVRVRVVLVRGGLVSFASVLERRHHYVPVDAVVPGLLRAADVPMVAQALADGGVTLAAEDLRDGSNRVVSAETVRREWRAAAPPRYTEHPTDRGVADLIAALHRNLEEDTP